jgi:hypothetical protein
MAMSNQGFFGSIFESPDEDPLLRSDDRTADQSARTDDARTDDARTDDARTDDARTDDRREDDWGDDDWMNDDAFSGDGASYGSDATFYDDLYGGADKRADDAASDDVEETDVQDVYVALDDTQPSLQTLNAAVDDGWRMTHVDLVGSGAFASEPQVVITIERSHPRSHPRSLFDFCPGG